jgi:hypothetical protein
MTDLEEFWTDIRPERLPSGPNVVSKDVFKQALRDSASARREGDTKKIELLNEVIEPFQAACPHPLERGHLQVASVSSAKVQVGDRVRWCLDCNKILSINGVPYSKVVPNEDHILQRR